MENTGRDLPDRARDKITRPVTRWVFDLDNTLYPTHSRLFHQVDRRIGEYVAALLDLDFDDAYRLQKHYYRTFGTTLSGLMKEHQADPTAYFDYVHDIDLTVLDPDPRLDSALGRLVGDKTIFTNANRGHAENVVERLGIARHFDGIFDIFDAGYVPKPAPETYDRFMSRHRIAPENAVLFEDSSANLKPAAALGMTTVLVGSCEAGVGVEAGADHIDHVTDDLAGWLERYPDSALEAQWN